MRNILSKKKNFFFIAEIFLKLRKISKKFKNFFFPKITLSMKKKFSAPICQKT